MISTAPISNRATLGEALQQTLELAHLVDDNSYALLLKKCIEFKALGEARKLHSLIAGGQYRHDSYLNNLLVQLYGKCYCLEEAQKVFDALGNKRNVYSWNIMITAYAQNGHLLEAKRVFDDCPRKTLVSWNAMVTAYSQNGCLHGAKELFDSMERRDIITWNAMLAAYAQNGQDLEATKLFKEMDLEGVEANNVSFISVLDACGRVGDPSVARELSEDAVVMGFTDDFKVGTALVSMIGKCGAPDDAKRMFDGLPEKNRGTAAWNALLSTYAHHNKLDEAKLLLESMQAPKDHITYNILMVAFSRDGHGGEALTFFRNMDLDGIPPDTATFANVLDSCTSLRDGKILHSCAVFTGHASHFMVGTAIVDMYGKCGSIQDAKAVFDGMTERDTVAWNAMVAAYAQNGYGYEALDVFRFMDLEGVRPTESTFVSVIDACTSVTAGAEGRLLHSLIVDSGYKLQGKVLNGLVTMYGKIGDLAQARVMFERLSTAEPVLWNAMIGAYAQSGHADQALELFHEMFNAGACPTQVTFSSVLVVCSRAGLLHEAREHFLTMVGDCQVAWISEHFHCMVDVLCRAGKLKEAQELILTMPYEANYPAWSTLISACSVHGDSKLGRDVADDVISMAHRDSGLYVILSQVFSSAGMENELARMQQHIKLN